MKLRTLATTALLGSAVALCPAVPTSVEAQTPPAATVDVTASAASIEVPGSVSATATFNVANLGGGPADPKMDLLLLFSPPDFLSHASVVGSPTVTGPDPAPVCRYEIGGRAYRCTVAQNGEYRMTVNVTVSSLTSTSDVSFVAEAFVPGARDNLDSERASVGLSEATTTTTTTMASTTTTTTTIAPATTAPVTTAAPTTAAPATTAAPSSGAGTLPATGSNDVSWAIVVLAAMALTGGGVAVRLARRSES